MFFFYAHYITNIKNNRIYSSKFRKNPDIRETVRTVYKLTQDNEIRWRCETRKDYLRCEIDRQIILERTKQELDQTVAELEQAKAKVEYLENLLKKHGINADEAIN